MTVRVVVADDQALIRAGFRMILDAEDDVEVVGEAATGLEAVDVVARARPDLVLMDIRMPELDGIAATRRIVAAGEAPRVLILTTFDLEEYVHDAQFERRTEFGQHTYRLRDIFARADRGTTAQPLQITLPAHDVLMLRLTAP